MHIKEAGAKKTRETMDGARKGIIEENVGRKNMRKGRRESVYDETASNRESPKGNERVHHEG